MSALAPPKAPETSGTVAAWRVNARAPSVRRRGPALDHSHSRRVIRRMELVSSNVRPGHEPTTVLSRHAEESNVPARRPAPVTRTLAVWQCIVERIDDERFTVLFAPDARTGTVRAEFGLDELHVQLRSTLQPGDQLLWMSAMRSLGVQGCERITRFHPKRLRARQMTAATRAEIDAEVERRLGLLPGA